jgi:hypothetical protein
VDQAKGHGGQKSELIHGWFVFGQDTAATGARTVPMNWAFATLI